MIHTSSSCSSCSPKMKIKSLSLSYSRIGSEFFDDIYAHRQVHGMRRAKSKRKILFWAPIFFKVSFL